MKFKTSALIFTLLAFAGAAIASQNTDNTHTMGKGASDKTIIFNKGSGSGNPKIRWNNSTSKLQFSNDGSSYGDIAAAGTSGGGVINYVSNSTYETDVSGLSAYGDASGTSPVDGTGGSPVETITRTTSSPLRGTGSALITKDAANRQGEGVSYAFTIDAADEGKPISISFDYSTGGTFVSGSSSDVRVFIYDVTNAGLIAVAQPTIASASGFYRSTFTAAANSTSYRLIWHTATTSANAWTFKFDNVVVGTPVPLLSNAATDVSTSFVTITPTNCGAISSSNYTANRNGPYLEVYGKFTYVTPAHLIATLDISSLVINGAVFGNTSMGVGEYWILTTSGSAANFGTSNQHGAIFFDGADTDSLYFAQAAKSNDFVKLNGDDAFPVNSTIAFRFQIPIVGWSWLSQ